ncbi:MAG: hypothetical protein K2L42_05075 [Clostridia bacterium]|nr:hypothetical protein [Clostridia bacterium]
MEKEKNVKKQIPLRVSENLYAELERWATDEFRSVNGQIEYLLTECVKYRKKGKKGLTEERAED